MSISVHCALCGHENELGRMFCVACGKRLHFDGPDAMSFSRQPRSFPFGRLLRIVLLILLLLAVVLGLLVFFPPAPLGVVTDGTGGQAAEARLQMVRSSISVGGAGAEVELTEAALNGWFSNRLDRVHAERITVRMTPGALTLEGACRVHLHGSVGRYFQTPLPLTLRLGAHLQAGRLTLDRVSVGMLALPGRLGDPVRQWFAARISPLWRELRLDSILRSVEIQHGRALLRLDRTP